MATLGQSGSASLGTNTHLHPLMGDGPVELNSATQEQHEALLDLRTRVYQKCATALLGEVSENFSVLDFSLEVLKEIDSAPNDDAVNAILLEQSNRALQDLLRHN